MEKVYTSIVCSTDIKNKIESIAASNGMSIVEYVNVKLNENLPVQKLKVFPGRKDTRIGAQIPGKIYKLLEKNQNNLSDIARKVKIYEIVLTAVLMGEEG